MKNTKANQARYYRAHKTECLERTLAWNNSHPKAMKEASGRHNWRMRILALLILGGRCAVCGVSDLRILQINHRDGGGRREIGPGRDARRFYRSIVNGERNTDDLEVRCANHNVLYEHEVGRRTIPREFINENGTVKFEAVVNGALRFPTVRRLSSEVARDG